MTTLELMKQAIHDFFIEKKPEKVLSYVTKDFRGYGLFLEEPIISQEEAKRVSEDARYISFMSIPVEVSECEDLSDDTATLCIRLLTDNQGEELPIDYRLLGISKLVDGERKLFLLQSELVSSVASSSIISHVQEGAALKKHILLEDEMLRTACGYAQIWTWVYEISKNRVRTFQNLRDHFDLPEYLDNYPQSWLDRGIVLPKYCELYREKVEKIRTGKSDSETFEIQTRYSDGGVHWSRVRINRLEEEPDFAICTSQPIDEEKNLIARMEMEEKRQSDNGDLLLAHFVTDFAKDKIITRNYRYQEREELQKPQSLDEQIRAITEYILKDEKKQAYIAMHEPKHLMQMYEQGIVSDSLDYRRLFPDGTVFWVRNVIHLVKDPTTGVILNYEYLYDIQEQKVNEELMAAIVSFGYELCASLMIDRDQVTILRSERLHGVEGLDILEYTDVNEAYAELIMDEDRSMYLEETSLPRLVERLKKEEHFEIMHRTIEDGTIHYKKDEYYAYEKESNICILVRSDVTAIVETEKKNQVAMKKALDKANAATKAKSDFLSRMSHEIRTPMNAIIGMANIAKENRSDFLQVFDCLDKIESSSQFLLALINDILEMSRIESGKVEIKKTEFSLERLLENVRTVVEPLALKSNIRYECVNRTDTKAHYSGDSMRIQQVLINLLTNAIKFTKEGGRVRFSVSMEKEEEDISHFRFVVEDTGVGMSKKFMKEMWKPFSQEDSSTTSKYQGSGLGLAISKTLVEAMGGAIEAESFQGIGTTFVVHIPLCKTTGDVQSVTKAHTHSTGHVTREDLAMLKGKQVLMAEDHPMNVMVANKLLEHRGIHVTVAENGKIAVDAFTRSAPGDFDLILMDIRMPVMDGLEATREIRALPRPDAQEIPIIAMTANALDEDRENSRKAGMNAHLAKPFEPALLYETIVEQLKAKMEKA